MVAAASADLVLATRAGIADDIAYLRPLYPAGQWRSHANFGQLSAFWLEVHASLRAQADQVQATAAALREGRLDAAGLQRVFVPQLNGFLQHLNGHHQIEDSAYFPKFRALDPRMAAGFDLLDRDHGAIHDALLGTVDRARRMLGAAGDDARGAADGYANAADGLHALLFRHLADEEDLVIPAMLDHGERRVG
jgi:hemerythrin-like domain-containing protein